MTKAKGRPDGTLCRFTAPDSHARICGYDMARMVAIFGMTLVNFKSVFAEHATEPAWLSAMIGHIEGRAAASFVVLAGAGVSLLLRRSMGVCHRQAVSAARRLLLRRSIFLFFAGLSLSSLWPADILHFYGLYMGIAAVVLTVPGRRLILAACAFGVVFLMLTRVLDYGKGWEGGDSGYIDLLTVSGAVRNTFFNGYYPVFPWTGFFLLGMWLGRKDVRDRALRVKLLFLSLAAAGASELISFIPFSKLIPGMIAGICTKSATHDFWTAWGPYPPSFFFMLSAAGTSLFIITVCLEIGERAAGRRFLRLFFSMGRFSLTYYIGHIVVGIYGMVMIGFEESDNLLFSFWVSCAFLIGSLGFVRFWEKRFLKGPIEWVLRKTTGSPFGAARDSI